MSLSPSHQSQVKKAKQMPLRVYLAESWNTPNLDVAEQCDIKGYTITQQWWGDRSTNTDLQDVWTAIGHSHVFVLDMRAPDFGKHHYGGSHIGVGMALACGKRVIVVLPEGAKPYTSLIADMCVHTTQEVMDQLDQLQSDVIRRSAGDDS